MHYLGLDVGVKRTGVAFASTDDDILFSLETIHHDSQEELVTSVACLVQERQIDEVVLGLPLLPSGEEGAQAKHVYLVADLLKKANITYSFVDERYTSGVTKDIDRDAAAACEILAVKLGNNS